MNGNQPIVQKLGSNKIVSAKRGTETSGKSSSFAPIISKEQIKFYKDSSTNREMNDKPIASNNNVDPQSQVKMNTTPNFLRNTDRQQ